MNSSSASNSPTAATTAAAVWVLATSPTKTTTATTATTETPRPTTTCSTVRRLQQTQLSMTGTTATNVPSVALMQRSFEQLEFTASGNFRTTTLSRLNPLAVRLPPNQEVEWWKLGGTLPNRDAVSNSSGETATSADAEAPVASRNEGNHRQYLVEKLVGDVIIGSGVTFVVAPFLTVVDKAIVQKSAGTHTLMGSAVETMSTIARAPLTYIRSPMFLLMWGVYACTYSTANSLKTLVEHGQKFPSLTTAQEGGSSSPVSARSEYGKAIIFAGTTAVNSVSSMLKDRAYSRMFSSSSSAVPKVVPFMSYGMWASRDMMVIGSSFLLPDLVSSRVQEAFPSLPTSTVHSLTQFLCPVATQVLAGPAHLAGLDWYNRPSATLWQRALHQYENFGSVVWARVARIAPGYGIGGIGNSRCRDAWRDEARRRWEERNLRNSNVSVEEPQATTTLLQ